MKSTYDTHAEQFLADTGTTFKAVKLGHFPYFPEDAQSRDVYEITLERNKRIYKFRFGQSINNSELDERYDVGQVAKIRGNKSVHDGAVQEIKARRGKIPTPYDVLVSITKEAPDTFQDFCLTFGYDTDSRKAEKIYFDVQKEWKEINRLFGDVLEQLREIQ